MKTKECVLPKINQTPPQKKKKRNSRLLQLRKKRKAKEKQDVFQQTPREIIFNEFI